MSEGKKDLQYLVEEMSPKLNEGQYVYICTNDEQIANTCNSIMQFIEKEGVTLIISKTEADTLNLSYDSIFAWITLEVHSSLNAVGLTAAFSNALAKKDISCNVVAGYYHDHIFVNYTLKDKAMQTLMLLAGNPANISL